MKKSSILFAFLVTAFLGAAALEATWTPVYQVKWVRVMNHGVLFQLDGFYLADADPNACADPGYAMFWIDKEDQQYEEKYSVVLSAFLSDRPVKVGYWKCGSYPNGSASMLNPEHIEMRRE